MSSSYRRDSAPRRGGYATISSTRNSGKPDSKPYSKLCSIVEVFFSCLLVSSAVACAVLKVRALWERHLAYNDENCHMAFYLFTIKRFFLFRAR